jgi:hypothetical protein
VDTGKWLGGDHVSFGTDMTAPDRGLTLPKCGVKAVGLDAGIGCYQMPVGLCGVPVGDEPVGDEPVGDVNVAMRLQSVDLALQGQA